MDVHLLSSAAIPPFQTWMSETFPGSKLIESHSDHMKYEIPKNINGVIQTMSYMFRVVEREKSNLQIAEYSLSETTLEQVSDSKLGCQTHVDQDIMSYVVVMC